MRHAQLEWGYPPPRPNFIRRIRTALIATAVGAAVGGLVVFSFVDRSVTLQGQSTQVASTPMLPLNPKRMDSEFYESRRGWRPLGKRCGKRVEH